MSTNGQKPLVEIDVIVEAGQWPDAVELNNLAHSGVDTAIQVADIDISTPAEISMVFSNDAQVKSLNAKWRNIDRPTNVLSFPQCGGSFDPPGSSGQVLLLGDIVMASETVVREANLAKIPLEHHICHLIIHGFLHLVGYDHQNDQEAKRMETVEIAALARLNIKNPY